MGGDGAAPPPSPQAQQQDAAAAEAGGAAPSPDSRDASSEGGYEPGPDDGAIAGGVGDEPPPSPPPPPTQDADLAGGGLPTHGDTRAATPSTVGGLTIATYNVSYDLSGTYDRVVLDLQPLGVDVVMLQETKQKGAEFFIALEAQGVKVAYANHAPSRDGHGMGGVAVLALSRDIASIVVLLADAGHDVLTVQISFSTGLQPVALTTAYVPHTGKPSERDATLAVVRRHAQTYAHRFPGRYVLGGDFNAHLANSAGQYASECRTPATRHSRDLQTLLDAVGLHPVHGWGPVGTPQAHSTSMPVGSMTAIANGTASHRGTCVDFLLVPTNTPAAAIVPLDTIPWQQAARTGTHRPVVARMQVPPSGTKRPKGPAQTPRTPKVPPAPPHGDRQRWHALHEAVSARLGKQLERGGVFAAATVATGDDKFNALNNIFTDVPRDVMPPTRIDPVTAATDAVHGPAARQWHSGTPMPPVLVALHNSIRRLRDRAALARQRQSWYLLAQLVRRVRVLERQAKAMRRGIERTWKRHIVDAIEDMRHGDRHNGHLLLSRLAPPTNASGASGTIPDAADGTPASEVFHAQISGLLGALPPPPPAAAPGHAAMDDVPSIPGDHDWLARDVTAADVHLVLYGHTASIKGPSACAPACRLCSMYAEEHEHYALNRKRGAEPPHWHPHAKTSVAPGPDGVRPEWVMWGRPLPSEDDDPEGDAQATLAYRMQVCDAIASATNSCLTEGKVPEAAVHHRITPLFKSGDPRNPVDYRHLCIGNFLPKVMYLIFTSRLSHWASAHDIFGKTQIGFRAHHSCEWHVWTLLETIKAQWRDKRPVYVLFLDLKKAYDMVHPAALKAVLLKMGVPARLVALLMDKAARRTGTPKINGEDTDEIAMLMGVGQGDVLSPLLFNFYLMSLVHKLGKAGLEGVLVSPLPTPAAANVRAPPAVRVSDLLYADDAAIAAPSTAQLQIAADVCYAWSVDWGMPIGTGARKTECVAFDPPEHAGRRRTTSPPNPPPITVGGHALAWADSYTYLGFIVDRRLSNAEQYTDAVRNLRGSFARYFARSKTVPALSAASVSEIFNTYALSAVRYSLPLLNPPPEATSDINSIIIRAGRLAMHASTGNYTVYDTLIQARTLLVKDLSRSARTRLFLSLAYPVLPSLAADLFNVLLTHARPGDTGAHAPWVTQVLADFAANKGTHAVAAPVVTREQKASAAAAVYARAVAYEEMKRSLHAAHPPQPRSVTSHPRSGTLAGQLDLADGLHHTHADLGHHKTHAPMSMHAPGGTAGIISTSTIADGTAKSNTLGEWLMALRKGRPGLFTYPIVPTFYMRPAGCKAGDAAHKEWTRRMHSDTSCPLCAGGQGVHATEPLSVAHVIFRCTAPNVVMQRTRCFTNVPGVLQQIVKKLCVARRGGTAAVTQKYMEEAKELGETASRLAAAADWQGDDWRFALHRLLLTSTWAESSLADTPAGVPCELSAFLGAQFHETSVTGRHRRPANDVWARWAHGSTKGIAGAWSLAVDVLKGCDHALSRVDDPTHLAAVAARRRAHVSSSEDDAIPLELLLRAERDEDFDVDERAPARPPPPALPLVQCPSSWPPSSQARCRLGDGGGRGRGTGTMVAGGRHAEETGVQRSTRRGGVV